MNLTRASFPLQAEAPYPDLGRVVVRAPEWLSDLHAFRAFAIVSIVVVHAFSMFQRILSQATASDFPVYLALDVAVESLLHGSTLYFALISGTLFTAVLQHRGWTRFFRSKLLNVALPYVVMTALFTAVDWRVGVGLVWVDGPGTFLRQIPYNLAWGKAIFAYWYIPIVVVLFVLTPPVVRLIGAAPWTAPLLMALPLAFSRTATDVTVQSVVYFLGAYTVGLWLGQDLRRRIEVLRRYRAPLAGLALVTTGMVAALMFLDVGRLGGWSVLQSLVYIQKLSIATLVLMALGRWPTRMPLAVDQLARHAFAIFFLHVIWLQILIDFTLRAGPEPSALMLFVASPALAAVAIALSWGVSRGLQEVLGHRSRWVVGA